MIHPYHIIAVLILLLVLVATLEPASLAGSMGGCLEHNSMDFCQQWAAQ